MTTIDLNCDLGEGFGVWEMGNDAAMIELATSVNIACGFQAGEAANLPMVHEVFADRAYEDDGSLVSRRKPGAVLHDPKAIAQRVVRMVQDGAVVSVTGKVIKMRTDTVCIHGDTPGAVDIAHGVRQALKDAGIEVAPFKKAA